ncbi:MAG: rod shape-determining protein MreC [Candidatus Omnitrophica bacterium]|nr:rod shape-determining protein MreC [Candidatus Omnitrophota bacterium]
MSGNGNNRVFSRRNWLQFIPLFLVAAGLFLIPPEQSVYFKRYLLHALKFPLTIFNAIHNRVMSIGAAAEFFREYGRYQRERDKLLGAANAAEEQRQENIRLRELLELKEKTDMSFTVCRVIGREPTNWLSCIILDKGRNAGIELNQPVLKYAGLAGKVIEVFPESAKVLLISDVNSRVVAIVQRTRQEGLLEGMGGGMCRLKYLSLDAEIELGDAVVTAGGGGVYPKGLLVGHIESVRVDRGGLYKSCIVRPSAALRSLEEVLCLKSVSVTAAF